MMALESTAPTLEAVFTSEVRAAMAERDERIRAEERARILALLDDAAVKLAVGVAAAQGIHANLPVDAFGQSKRLKDYADIWGAAARTAALAEVKRQIEVAR